MLGAPGLRVGLRIGGDADLEIGDAPEARDEIGGKSVAAGMRRIPLADPARRVAAQRDDVADAGLPVIGGDGVDLVAGRGDAGQMRGRLQRRLVADAADGRMGPLAGRAAGAVGHRDEARRQRFKPLDHLPQPQFHLGGPRRREFEGDTRRTGIEIANRVGGEQAARLSRAGVLRHQRSSLSISASGTPSRKSPATRNFAASGR